jgi:hypothetical protein
MAYAGKNIKDVTRQKKAYAVICLMHGKTLADECKFNELMGVPTYPFLMFYIYYRKTEIFIPQGIITIVNLHKLFTISDLCYPYNNLF